MSPRRNIDNDFTAIKSATYILKTFINDYNNAVPFLNAIKNDVVTGNTTFNISDLLRDTFLTDKTTFVATNEIAEFNYDAPAVTDPIYRAEFEHKILMLKEEKTLLLNIQQQFYTFLVNNKLKTDSEDIKLPFTYESTIKPFTYVYVGGAKKTRKPRQATKPKPKSASKKTATKK